MTDEHKRPLAARRVLDDARRAFDLLEKCEDDDLWRVYFVSCLALLRSVGHVLDRVDGEQSDSHRLAVDRFWSGIKADKDRHGIFWYFVETFRNNVLKTYEFGAEPMTYGLVFSKALDLPGGHVDPGIYSSDGIIVQHGPYSGHDARDLIQDAIVWWEGHLAELEQILLKSVEDVIRK
jgi:hypothetical protein